MTFHAICQRSPCALHLLCSIQPSPCPTCRIKQLLRLRGVSRTLALVIDRFMIWILRAPWPFREGRLQSRIVSDCYEFRVCNLSRLLLRRKLMAENRRTKTLSEKANDPESTSSSHESFWEKDLGNRCCVECSACGTLVWYRYRTEEKVQLCFRCVVLL